MYDKTFKTFNRTNVELKCDTILEIESEFGLLIVPMWN